VIEDPFEGGTDALMAFLCMGKPHSIGLCGEQLPAENEGQLPP
jgi:hypothetical protein